MPYFSPRKRRGIIAASRLLYYDRGRGHSKAAPRCVLLRRGMLTSFAAQKPRYNSRFAAIIPWGSLKFQGEKGDACGCGREMLRIYFRSYIFCGICRWSTYPAEKFLSEPGEVLEMIIDGSNGVFVLLFLSGFGPDLHFPLYGRRISPDP